SRWANSRDARRWDGELHTFSRNPQHGDESSFDRHVNACFQAEPMPARQANRAAEPLNAGEGNVEADAPTGEEVGALTTRGKAGQEQKLEERLVVRRLRENLGDYARLDSARANGSHVNTRPIVTNGHGETISAATRAERERGFARLAQGLPHVG